MKIANEKRSTRLGPAVIHFLVVLQLCLMPGSYATCWRQNRLPDGNSWPAAYLPGRPRKTYSSFYLPTRVPTGRSSTVSSLFDLGASVLNEAIGDIRQSVLGEDSEDGTSTFARTPHYEVQEAASSYTITIDLPGCKKADVDAQILRETGDRKTLKVIASRTRAVRSWKHQPQEEVEEKGEGESEVYSGEKTEHFEVSFMIGVGVDIDRIRGTLEDGVLTLVLPKAEPEPEPEAVDIPITPANSPAGGNRMSLGGKGSSSSTSNGNKRGNDEEVDLKSHQSSKEVPVKEEGAASQWGNEEADSYSGDWEEEEDEAERRVGKTGAERDSSADMNTHVSLT
ncbi:unnamed protein product [Discosporangium mesarthrocarpum]